MQGKEPSREEGRIELPDGFVPGPKDIICARGKTSYDHVGNRRFRVTIAMNLKRYVEAQTRHEKSQVVHAVVSYLRHSSPTGAFVKMNYTTGKWMTVCDAVAREKVGHALRDALSVSNVKAPPFQTQFKFAKDKKLALLAAQDRIFRSLDMGQRSDDLSSAMVKCN